MKQNTKKPITMTKIVATNTRFIYIFTILTAITLLYECFHIRQGSIIKVVGFTVVTILFYRYAKKTKLEVEEIKECARETFHVRRKQKKWIIFSILILICIFSISSVISFVSRRPSWEYKSDKRTWQENFSSLEAIPDTIPKGAKKITYYCAELPIFITNVPSFYIRYILNDKDYKQAKEEIMKQGTLEEALRKQNFFNLEPEDMKQHNDEYVTYLFQKSNYNTAGVMLNDNKRELCYFYARYYWHDIIETDTPDLEK